MEEDEREGDEKEGDDQDYKREVEEGRKYGHSYLPQ